MKVKAKSITGSEASSEEFLDFAKDVRYTKLIIIRKDDVHNEADYCDRSG